MFLPSTSTSCLLSASLVQPRRSHSQDGLLLCGGCCEHDAEHSCEEFSPATGNWARTNHTLQERRVAHMSWRVEPEGTILMDGITSEIVKHDGTTERSFDLKYPAKLYETFKQL